VPTCRRHMPAALPVGIVKGLAGNGAVHGPRKALVGASSARRSAASYEAVRGGIKSAATAGCMPSVDGGSQPQS
jgi:hypothetical protein